MHQGSCWAKEAEGRVEGGGRVVSLHRSVHEGWPAVSAGSGSMKNSQRSQVGWAEVSKGRNASQRAFRGQEGTWTSTGLARVKQEGTPGLLGVTWQAGQAPVTGSQELEVPPRSWEQNEQAS